LYRITQVRAPPSDREEWLLVILSLLLLLLLLRKRIETALRDSARLLCGKLAVLSLTEAIMKTTTTKNIASISITRN
jgi:hypothetical protein